MLFVKSGRTAVYMQVRVWDEYFIAHYYRETFRRLLYTDAITQ